MNVGISYYTNISSLIDYENQLKLSHNKLFLKSLIKSNGNNLIVNSTSLPNMYYDYILNSTYTLTLTNSEYMKYRYQPKLFCHDVYGTTELWSLLLKINNFSSISEFNSKKIKVFDVDIFNILNEILINEESRILENYDSIDYR